MAQAVPDAFAATAAALWQAWKDRFLMPDGRVVDTLQDAASHSEGQGYGMVLATYFDDPEAFARMFQWTERHLAVRADALLAWRWLPDALNSVPDRNNASDGDLFYAWALVRAANRFGNRAYMARAQGVWHRRWRKPVSFPCRGQRGARRCCPRKPVSSRTRIFPSTRPITCPSPCARWPPRPGSARLRSAPSMARR